MKPSAPLATKHPAFTGASPASALRVSHAEREPVVERLQQAYAEGRLDKAELDLRLHLAMTAKTRADLDAVLADLSTATHAVPSDPALRAPNRRRPDRRAAVLAALAHVLGIVTLFVGPLIMICTRARRSPYVRRHIAAALNFQLTLLLVTIVTFGVGGIAVRASRGSVAGVAALLALAGTHVPLSVHPPARTLIALSRGGRLCRQADAADRDGRHRVVGVQSGQAVDALARCAGTRGTTPRRVAAAVLVVEQAAFARLLHERHRVAARVARCARRRPR